MIQKQKNTFVKIMNLAVIGWMLLAGMFGFAFHVYAKVSVQVSVPPGNYSLGQQDSVNIYIQTNYDASSDNRNYIYTIVTLVNGQKVGQFNTSLSDSSSEIGGQPTTWQTVHITSANGFKVDNNNITVNILNQSGQQVATSSTTLKVVAPAVGETGGSSPEGSPCTPGSGDLCALHLICDSIQGSKTFNTCIKSGQVGWQCDTSTDLCDPEASPPLVCVAAAGQRYGTCQKSGTQAGQAPTGQQPAGQQPAAPGATQNVLTNPQDNCTDAKPDPLHCLINPLPTDDLQSMLLLLIRGFLALIGIWAVTFIIIGGFRLVAAQGNEEAYTAAKKTLIWAILGLVIALLSFSAVAIVEDFIGAKTVSVSLPQTANQNTTK
jgi:hypothetical protein